MLAVRTRHHALQVTPTVDFCIMMCLRDARRVLYLPHFLCSGCVLNQAENLFYPKRLRWTNKMQLRKYLSAGIPILHNIQYCPLL